MSVSLLRVIEVKRNDKWEILPFPTVINKYYNCEKDDFDASKELGNGMYLSYYNEASLLLRDYVFGNYCDNNLKNCSSIPKDICDDVKNIIKDRHPVYCINLKDLSVFISKEDEHFEKEVEEFYNRKNFNLLNAKLNCILKGKNFKDFESEKTKMIENNEILNDEDLEYDRNYIWEELYYYICALNSEYNYINDTLYNMFNDWPECRIYYFLD